MSKRELLETDARNLKSSIHRIKEIDQEKIGRIRCVIGHMGYGLHSCFNTREVFYTTVLREPVERVISLYNHTKNTPGMPVWKKGFNSNTTIEDFVKKKIYFHTDNGQTRYIASESGFPIDLNQKYSLDSNDLELAKNHLRNNIDLVGVQHDFDCYLVLLKHLIGLNSILYTKSNVTAMNQTTVSKNDLSEDTLQMIAEYNQYDIELYEYACKKFIETRRDYKDVVEKNLTQFKILNDKKKAVTKIKALIKSRIPLL